MKQIIITDLDGTAIDSPEQKLPNDRLVAATKNLQKSYHISAATGRVWTFAKPVLKELGLVDPCIISAGTQICDPKTGEIIWQKTVDQKALSLAIELLKEYPDWKLLHNDSTEDEYFFGGDYPKDFNNREPVYFLEQVFIPDETAFEIQRKLNEIDDITCVMVNAQKPGSKDLHIINKDATKEQAVMELLRILNLEKKDSIGIGDGHNDLHLFNAVGRKIAMGNAVKDLKNEADEIIGSIDEDGLAKFFESLI